MGKDEFLSSFSEQIQYKKVCPVIQKEIADHIEDRTSEYMEFGLCEKDAEERAVGSMGDPVELGNQMDKLHRPKFPFAMLGIALILTLVGILMQSIIFNDPQINNHYIADTYLRKTIIYNLFGFVIMVGMMFVDYRLIGRYSLTLYLVYMIGSVIYMFARSQGSSAILGVGNVWTFRYFITLSYSLIFTALLYRFRKQKLKGILKLLGMTFFTFFVFLITDILNGSSFLIVTACCLIIYTIAVVKGIYQGKKWLLLGIAWVPTILLLAFFLIDLFVMNANMTVLAAYQVERIKAMINPAAYSETSAYMIMLTRNAVKEFTLFGNMQLVQNLGVYGYSDFVVLNIFSYFGILAGAVVIVLLVSFLLRAFHITLTQHNQLGLLLGSMCSVNLLLQIFLGVMSNIRFGPVLTYTIPFLSFGLSATLMNALVVGLLLCVYRNTDLLWEEDRFDAYHFSFRA